MPDFGTQAGTGIFTPFDLIVAGTLLGLNWLIPIEGKCGASEYAVGREVSQPSKLGSAACGN